MSTPSVADLEYLFYGGGAVEKYEALLAFADAGLDVTDVLAVVEAGAGDGSAFVTKALYDANTILAANSDNTPAALAVAASRIVGRGAAGNIDDLTGPEASVVVNGALFVRKTGTQSVNSGNTGTTLVDDSALVVPVAANATYIVEAFIRYVAGTTGDLKLGWTAPASATFTWAAYGPQSGATSVSNASAVYRRRSVGDTEIVGGAGTGGGNEGVAVPKGLLVTSATAGNLQMQLAQGASDGTDTSVLADSWLRLVRVA